MSSPHLISKEIRELYGRFKDAFEEAGLLQEFVAVLDRINSTLAVAERYRPPSVIVRTLVYDDLKMLDDFAREYRGYVGKVMDNVCMELHGLLYEVLGGVNEDDADEEWAAAKWIGFGPERGGPNCR
jgi:hypothetical protein